ncbi:MAG: ABC transporter permease subunit [Melioribacteraceae bacterium]
MVNTLIKIIKYQIHDIIRSKWILIYTIFFFAFSYSIFSFSDNFTKIVISLLNVTLLFIPLVSIIFGTIYLYNNKEYIVFMLSQPIKRETLYLGLYFGMAAPLILSFLFGAGIPFLIFVNKFTIDNPILFLLITSGILQTLIFSSLAFYITTINENKLLGLGVSIFFWLFFTAIYDGIILLLLNNFQDYPLEKISLALTFLNPIDLARVLLILKLDISALMGYTGAVFQKFFSNSFGIFISLIAMTLWFLIPLIAGLKKFIKKDF